MARHHRGRAVVAFVAAAILFALLAAPAPARADRRVFLNGVDLTNVDVSDRRFDNATVRFDRNGNVHITVRGFEISRSTVRGTREPPARADSPHTRPARSTPVRVTQRYFLASQQKRRGAVQYDIQVHVNSKHIATVRSDRDPVVTEITDHVLPGRNRVKLIAVKNYGKDDRRRSHSPTDTMEVVIGEGSVAKGVVSIRKPVLRYERNAGETRGFADSFVFESR